MHDIHKISTLKIDRENGICLEDIFSNHDIALPSIQSDDFHGNVTSRIENRTNEFIKVTALFHTATK